MRLDEMVSVADLRSVVKAQFKQYKDVTNPKVAAWFNLGFDLGCVAAKAEVQQLTV